VESELAREEKRKLGKREGGLAEDGGLEGGLRCVGGEKGWSVI
jgi:hypothetical protein